MLSELGKFREVLGHYPSGITVIGGIEDGRPIGFTCQAFYSVSLEPPLISFSVMSTSTTYPRLRRTGRFSVNVLAEGQERVSTQFARSGTDKWAGVSWLASRQGNPLINDALAWFDCEIWAEHEAGDHTIVIGLVTEFREPDREAREPLVYFRGRYRGLRDAGAP